MTADQRSRLDLHTDRPLLAGTIFMIMSHLFNGCDEEDGQAELRDDFSNGELRLQATG
jgi:hypothetical protein